MSEINNNIRATDVLSDYRIQQTEETKSGDDLGEAEFYELLVAQLENQNPLEPQDNTEWIAQLAQFSTLEEQQKLTATVDSLATQFQSSQALQASSLVGRNVLTPATTSSLGIDGTLEGVVDLEASTSNLTVSILNASGELVRQIPMGQNLAGSIPFSWDGRNENGELMPDDIYTVQAQASVNGNTEQVGTLLSSNVDSVSIGSAGEITLNLSGRGSVALADVREII